MGILLDAINMGISLDVMTWGMITLQWVMIFILFRMDRRTNETVMDALDIVNSQAGNYRTLAKMYDDLLAVVKVLLKEGQK
jgi:hypothetical protein